MSVLNNTGCQRTAQIGYYTARNIKSAEQTIPNLDDCEYLSEYVQRMAHAARTSARAITTRANEIEIYAAIQLIRHVAQGDDYLTPLETAFQLREHFGFYSKNNNIATCAVSEALRRLEEVGALEKVRVFYQSPYCRYPSGYRDAYRVVNLAIDVPPEF